MKLTKSEKQELREMIKFEDGVISDKDQLENDLIKFCNDKYIEKYKEKKDYQHIKLMHNFLNPDGTKLNCLIPEDNELLEITSIVLYGESTKDRRERGIKTKNESKNIEPIGQNDIGQKRQYEPFYQLNGEKIYLTFESVDNYSETSTTRWQCEQVYAQKYTEIERSVDASVNEIFERYYRSKHKNEVLYKLLVHLNDNQLDYFSQESLSFFLQQELKNYHILSNQQKVLDCILSGEIPDAQQKKTLKRLLNIPKKK